MQRQLGVGVLGLHEGLTMLVALTRPERPAGLGGPVWRPAHARAVAGCDLRPEKLAAARARCPGLFYTSDYGAMLARDDVDIVAIYTPDPLHGDHIRRAFAAGKHVICTKPLVNTLDDARALARLAPTTTCKLLVGQSTRFFEPFARQRAAYERGEIGRLELLDAHYVHRMDWFYEKSPWAATESDWVFLGMSHPLDLAVWYLGQVDEVHALASFSALARRYGARSPDICSVHLRGGTAVGRVLGHYGLHEVHSARNPIELWLCGDAGSSLAQYHGMRYVYTNPDGTTHEEDSLASRRTYYFNDEVHGSHHGEFANYVEYFARALIEGTPYRPDLREGLEVFCVMEAVRRAIARNAAVLVDEVRGELAG